MSPGKRADRGLEVPLMPISLASVARVRRSGSVNTSRRRPSLAREAVDSRLSNIRSCAVACRSSQQPMLATSSARKVRGFHGIALMLRDAAAACQFEFSNSTSSLSSSSAGNPSEPCRITPEPSPPQQLSRTYLARGVRGNIRSSLSSNTRPASGLPRAARIR